MCGREVEGRWKGDGREVEGRWKGDGREVEGRWKEGGREVEGRWCDKFRYGFKWMIPFCAYTRRQYQTSCM